MNIAGNKDLIRAVLSWPSCVLAFISLVCNSFVFKAALDKIKTLKRQHKQQDNDVTVFSMIACLTLSGSGYNILWMIEQLPAMIYPSYENHDAKYQDPGCAIIGVFIQIIATLDPMWHSLIAFSLVYLLCKKNISCLKNKEVYYITIILVTSIIAALVLIPFGSYGGFFNYEHNGEEFNYECWIKGNFEWIWISMVLIAWIAHFIVLIIVMCYYCWNRYWSSNNGTNYRDYNSLYSDVNPVHMGHLFNRLWPWLLLFTLTRLPTLVVRVFEFTKGYQTHPDRLWMVFVHNMSDASFGVGNIIVWCCNRRLDKTIENEADNNHGGSNSNNPNPGVLLNVHNNDYHRKTKTTQSTHAADTQTHSQQPRWSGHSVPPPPPPPPASIPDRDFTKTPTITMASTSGVDICRSLNSNSVANST